MAGSPDQTIGPYRLLRRLGRGGMADVWLAEWTGPGGETRELALKLVDASPVEGMRPDALLREARLVSWLDDASIVRVEAADIEGDTVWMAMEYCDGGSVTSLLKRLRAQGLPMPPAVALRIGRDVALALAAAHGAKSPEGEDLCVVHRDLKPGNVLLTKEGAVKVCDFGIAKATEDTNVTGTGILKGTASYIAPELWHDVRAFSPASDAFALGTLLVEMLTLERLHAGGAMPMVYKRIVEGSASDDAERAARICPPVVPLLQSLLARNPERRSYNLRGVAKHLEDLLKEVPGPPDPGLLLRLLDFADGNATSPSGLPLRVGQAWHTIVDRLLSVELLLAPGPGGADRTWELAMHAPPVVLSAPEPPEQGFGPPELRTSQEALPAVEGPTPEDLRNARTVPFAVPSEPGGLPGWEPLARGKLDLDDERTEQWAGPPKPSVEAEVRQTTSYRDLSPVSEDRQTTSQPIKTLAEDRQTTSYTNLSPAADSSLDSLTPPAPSPPPPTKPRRPPKQAPPIPWGLVGILVVLLVVLLGLIGAALR